MKINERDMEGMIRVVNTLTDTKTLRSFTKRELTEFLIVNLRSNVVMLECIRELITANTSLRIIAYSEFAMIIGFIVYVVTTVISNVS